MTTLYWIGLATTVALMIYLIYALFRAEDL
jgi:K+-transporting ATPase KdpF subunit